MGFKKQLKNRIKYEILKRGFRISNVFNFNYLESVLYQLLLKNERVNFIQIGANDGKRFDPIYEFIKLNKENVAGFVVEPVKDYFNDLCKTYENYNDIIPVNLAIHNSLTETIIYKVAKEFEDKLPELALGIASLNPNHHIKTNIPLEFLSQETVKCMSLSGLIEKYNIQDVNLLVIDAEGYDYDILINIDFSSFCPPIIHFEHGLKKGMMTAKQFDDLKVLFFKNDYQLFVDKSDVTAVKTLLFI